MQCPHCGKVNLVGALSCARCARSLPLSAPMPLPGTAQSPVPCVGGGWKPLATGSLGSRSTPHPGRLVARGHIVGTVRGFQSRTESTYSLFLRQQRSWIVWTFRVERFDSQGNLLQRVPVELRGLNFNGAIN